VYLLYLHSNFSYPGVQLEIPPFYATRSVVTELLKERILSHFSRVISCYILHFNIIVTIRSQIFQLVVLVSFKIYL
jgi:hypothetical protein